MWGTKRIYPGYDKCFNEIKAFMADFVYELTGFDVQSQAFRLFVQRPNSFPGEEVNVLFDIGPRKTEPPVMHEESVPLIVNSGFMD